MKEIDFCVKEILYNFLKGIRKEKERKLYLGQVKLCVKW